MNRRRRATTGFSLIEIMVVIFIIGISISVVSLVVSRGGPQEELQEIAERFATVGSFASERAILTNQPVGLMLEPPAWQAEDYSGPGNRWRYRWQRMTSTGWQDEPELAPVALPATVHLDVTVEGQLWEWQEAPEVRLPMAVFYPSGEVTQFSIEFRDERVPEFSQQVAVNEWGELEWLEGAQREEASNALQ